MTRDTPPLTELEQKIFGEYTRKKHVVDRHEPDAHRVFLKVGVQSFIIGEVPMENAEHADWLRTMLAKALAKMVEEII